MLNKFLKEVSYAEL